MTKLQLLGNMTAQSFLDNYWQKRPLLIRNAIPHYQCPLSADELAGLACEDHVESRIVIEKHDVIPWSVKYGPFSESEFSTLPATHWTLLVQECNKHIEAFDDLLNEFNFVPNWRLDDIMVSYAPKHGSVGPHVDQYDVFLLQAQGQRQWQISESQFTANDFRDDTELRIFKEFTAHQQWTLQAGDMLYLPPGIGHFGVALDECMTISIGFRAPAQLQLLSAFLDDCLAQQEDDLFAPRYQDTELRVPESPGKIEKTHIDKLKQLITNAFKDENQFSRCMGRYLTETKNPLEVLDFETEYALSNQEFENHFSTHQFLQRNSHYRFAYISVADTTYLFVDGVEFALHEQPECAAMLCDNRTYRFSDWQSKLGSTKILQLLTQLYNQQYIIDI